MQKRVGGEEDLVRRVGRQFVQLEKLLNVPRLNVRCIEDTGRPRPLSVRAASAYAAAASRIPLAGPLGGLLGEPLAKLAATRQQSAVRIDEQFCLDELDLRFGVGQVIMAPNVAKRACQLRALLWRSLVACRTVT